MLSNFLSGMSTSCGPEKYSLQDLQEDPEVIFWGSPMIIRALTVTVQTDQGVENMGTTKILRSAGSQP